MSGCSALMKVMDELDRRGIEYLDNSDYPMYSGGFYRILVEDEEDESVWMSAIDGQYTYGHEAGMVEYWDSGMQKRGLNPVSMSVKECIKRFAGGLEEVRKE